MPKIDLTISITVIVAIAAIISPVLTTLLNNNHQLQLKRLELRQEEYNRTILYKREIFENFLKGLSQISQSATRESLDLYSEYYPLAYMYLPPDLQKKLSELNPIVRERDMDKLIPYVDFLSVEIHKVLQAL